MEGSSPGRTSFDPTDRGIAGTVMDAARLLVNEVHHWLPVVAVLAMIASVPEALLEHYLPDAGALLGEVAQMDTETLLAGLGMALVVLGLGLVIQLLALMLAFVILADLSAGRTPDILQGLRRLASWKLQFVWLAAGLFEQTAISMWFLGGALFLLPIGLVTTVAYEEDSGFAAFPRALQLGLMEMGPARPGMRVAVAVTIGFFVGFLVNMLISFVSCATTAASSGPGLFDFYTTLQGGGLPVVPPAASGAASWLGAVFTVLLSPIAMLPTVFMMTVQQMTYWQARRFQEAQARLG